MSADGLRAKKQPATLDLRPRGGRETALRGLAVLALLFGFLVGVKGLGDGFNMLGRDLLQSFFTATENPFIGLMVGILATTLAQSSSVTTSMIVAMVAAPENPLPLANAVPMIMGANIGTTVTNTIVSMAHMARPAEFRRAFAVATCHDFFNLFAVAVLLPLELATGYLRRTASLLQHHLPGVGSVEYKSPLKVALGAALQPVRAGAKLLSDSTKWQGVLLILVSGALIFLALIFIVRLMRSLMESRVEVYLTRALSQGALVSIVVGAIVTIMVQSSSITTSLLVPMAGAGVLSLRRAFPLTLGANIGTTVTALLASLGASGIHADAGMTIALVHLLFNLTATVLVYPVRAIRNLPLAAARRLADFATHRRRWAIVYVLLLFYGLPAAFAFLGRFLN